MSGLHAQQVYKSVDKQGRVTYSEVPPSAASGNTIVGDGAGSSSNSTGLPYSLQQVVTRYPVTLYTNADCGPCINGRLLLTQRGVPFTERSIASNEDIEAYKRLNSDNTLPMLTIATQQIKGYEEGEWTRYLDAAGYPKTSTLPRNYNNPAPTPLTVKKVVEKPTVVDKPPAVTGRPAPADTGSNPAGIKF
ncbi:MAG: glutaredoxin family protein [Burkholderiaceae bacterium]